MKHYILKKGEAVSCPDTKKWARWYEKSMKQRQLAITWFDDRMIRVSTVFLAMDHNFLNDHATPVLWETMVFGLKKDHMRRYQSKEDALKGHESVCSYVRRVIKVRGQRKRAKRKKRKM